jgi:hypothetical protein
MADEELDLLLTRARRVIKLMEQQATQARRLSEQARKILLQAEPFLGGIPMPPPVKHAINPPR